MSQPIYTLILVDKLNDYIFTKEYDSENDAQLAANQYPHSCHGSFHEIENYDMEYSIVFGVEVTTGSSSGTVPKR